MMPWPKDHKSRTHERIVAAAAAAFRAGGVSDVRLEDVMAGAGLTHGGFYAHFASKDDLVREALERASSETVEMLSRALSAVPRRDWFRAVIDAYLSPVHVAHPERGCPLAALGPEVARAGGATRRHLADATRRRVAWMRRLLLREQSGDATDDQVIGTLACMVGGVVLARTFGGHDADAVLAACRSFLDRALRHAPVPSAPPPANARRRERASRRVTRRSGGRSR